MKQKWVSSLNTDIRKTWAQHWPKKAQDEV